VPAPVDLQAVTFKELTMIGTRVYSRDDIRTAAGLVTSGAFDPEPFLTDVVSIEQAPSALDDLRAGRAMKILVSGRS
jgi:(R,R)-butanediol dehydrogenase / meso-butanediol dehydrogenase / diacetyl reductase